MAIKSLMTAMGGSSLHKVGFIGSQQGLPTTSAAAKGDGCRGGGGQGGAGKGDLRPDADHHHADLHHDNHHHADRVQDADHHHGGHVHDACDEATCYLDPQGLTL